MMFCFCFSDRLRRIGRAPRNLTAGYILKKDIPKRERDDERESVEKEDAA